MNQLTTEDLLDLEFVDAAEWTLMDGNLTCRIFEARVAALTPLFRVSNAL